MKSEAVPLWIVPKAPACSVAGALACCGADLVHGALLEFSSDDDTSRTTTATNKEPAHICQPVDPPYQDVL
jgi:hypothetical protein